MRKVESGRIPVVPSEGGLTGSGTDISSEAAETPSRAEAETDEFAGVPRHGQEAPQPGVVGKTWKSLMNAWKTYLTSPTGQLPEEVDKLPIPSTTKLALKRLCNVWDKGIDPASRGRLSDDSLNALMKELGVIFRNKRNEWQSTSDHLHYLEPIAHSAVTTEAARTLGDYGIAVLLSRAIAGNPNKVVATTYTIPGSLENHIVSIYAKNGYLQYVDPKGDPPPRELKEALQKAAQENGLTYSENSVQMQNDTMNCGSYAAFVLKQLHEGKDPLVEMERGNQWIEAVKQMWAKQIIDSYRPQSD